MTETTALCEIKVGFFLLRPCGRAAQQQCYRCGKCACRDHLGLLHMTGSSQIPLEQEEPSRICVDCRRLEQNSTRDNSDSRTEHSNSRSSSSSSSSPAEAEWKGAGGAFAGAGATVAWAAANANPPLPLGPTTAEQRLDPTISAQNLAMFDQVAHADEGSSKNGAFDS